MTDTPAAAATCFKRGGEFMVGGLGKPGNFAACDWGRGQHQREERARHMLRKRKPLLRKPKKLRHFLLKTSVEWIAFR
jgi:hypothetical protein